MADESWSIDQFADEMTAAEEKPAAEAEEPVEAAPEEATDELELPEGGDAEKEEEPEAEDEAVVPPVAAIEPPRSWSKEDATAWAQTPPAAQAVIMRREADRDRAVAQAHQKTSELNGVVKEIADRYAKAEPHLQEDFKQRWNIDWRRVAQDDNANGTANYALWRSQMEAEKETLEAVAAERDKSSRLARHAFLEEEGRKLAELVPELIDPVKGPKERGKIGAYLKNQGFDDSVLGDISATELNIARKAMLWDEAQENAKKQAAAPKKAPAVVPKVVSPASGAPVSPKRALQGLNDRLTKTGKLDDFVALMNAEDEQRSKRQVRR